MKESFWVKIIFAVLGALIVFAYLMDFYDLFFQLLFVTIFAAMVVFIMYRLRKNFTWLEHWASQHKFKYRKGFSRAMRFERFNESRHKSYFKSRSVKSNFDTAPSIEGQYNNKRFWFFGLIGVYPFNKILGSSNYKFWDFSLKISLIDYNKKVNDRRQKFVGWCMEFKTVQIPISLIVRRDYLGGKDEIDTESINFEKLYHVDVYEGKGTLQLLDPMMIQLIMESGIAAFEFSNSSVALYYTLHKPTLDQLDHMLEVGSKIAEQVDLNFPLGKYEKN